MSMRHRSGLLVLMISTLLFFSVLFWEMSDYSTGSGRITEDRLVSYIPKDYHLTNESSPTHGSLQSKANSSNQVSRLEDKEVYALPTSKKPNLEVKLLLAYTKFYGCVLPTYLSEYDKSVVVAASFSDCEYKCKWTTNKNDYSKSDAVVFHLYNNLDNKDFVLSELPTRRNVNQKWVLIIREPPAFYYPVQLKLLNDMFNLTMTFQSTADIFIPYGGYWNLTEDRKRRPPINYLKGKNKTVVWLVSNCITSSRRERYVTDLQKYIDIDVFGACGKPITGKYSPLMAEFANKYKFYIAFENSDCEDYITEKFWRSLYHGMIPIVRGHRVDYKKFAPPHSYIHADSFITPKALAEYLKAVSKSPELFQKHHEWRRLYDADFKHFTFNKNWMCDLCTQVHTSSRKTVDVFQEFSETTKCFTYHEPYGRNRTGERLENIMI